jgi:putative tricarboxylic transport membrane protein
MPHRDAGEMGPILLIVGGLVALIAIIGLGGGFIPATAILFAATARAFGRRALLADLGIGLAIGLGAYLVFAKLLTLSLPVGPLERLI